MSHLRALVPLMLVLAVAGCVAPVGSSPSYRARLADGEPQARAAIEDGLSALLGGVPARVGAGALQQGAKLEVSRADEGSDEAATFVLEHVGGRCDLVHVESGRRQPLAGVECVRLGEPRQAGARSPAGGGNGSGAERRFRPADFGTGPDSLYATLACPRRDRAAEVAAVHCTVEVDAGGRAGNWTRCAVPIGTAPVYAWAVEAAAERARFRPARVDGRSVSVLMSFRVLFEVEPDRCAALAVRNTGCGRTDLAMDHVGPQEILAEGPWWRDLSGASRGDRHQLYRSFRGHGPLASVKVDAEGRPSSSRYESRLLPAVPMPGPILHRAEPLAVRQGQRTRDMALAAIEQATFVPGFERGRPVAMRYCAGELLP